MSFERTKNGCGVKFTCFLGLEGLGHSGSPNFPNPRLCPRRAEPYRRQRLDNVSERVASGLAMTTYSCL